MLGGVGDVPVRAREAERLLAAGESPEAAARAAAEEIEPGHDLHAQPRLPAPAGGDAGPPSALEEAAGHGT